MSKIIDAPTTAIAVVYDVTEEQIAIMRKKYDGMTADTVTGYEAVKMALKNIGTVKSKIENRRVALKADSLAYGRAVDSVARRLQSLIIDIEEPLKSMKSDIDNRAQIELDRLAKEQEEIRNKAMQDAIDEQTKANDMLAAKLAEQDRELKALREAAGIPASVEKPLDTVDHLLAGVILPTPPIVWPRIKIDFKIVGGSVKCKFTTRGINGVLTFSEDVWPHVKREFEKIADVTGWQVRP